MINRLQGLISVANALRARARRRPSGGLRGRGGQIATLLLLMVVAVLVFVLMTANLGQMSLASTRMANAADGSALLLGSLLASKSNALYEQLGHKEQKCVKSGILGIVLAIVMVIIVIVIAVVTWGAAAVLAFAIAQPMMAMAIGAAAGAIGGAIGGAIAGTGALMGAIQGAAIGAAIGGAASSAAAGIQKLATISANTAVTSLGTSASTAEAAAVSTAAFDAVMAFAPYAAAGNMAFSAGSSLYSASVMDQMRQDAIKKVTDAINGLPEYDRIRESVVFQVMLQTVDDPTTVVDNDSEAPDSDGDGDTTEKVPFFQVWWAKRTKKIQAVIPELTRLVGNFLNGPLTAFANWAVSTYQVQHVPQYDADGNPLPPLVTAGALATQEVHGADGIIAEVARVLTSAGIPVDFWAPGPDPAALQQWLNQGEETCEQCAEPPGFDEVDFAGDTLKHLAEFVLGDGRGGETLVSKFQTVPSHVVGTWQTWVKFFYDPDQENQENREDAYDELDRLINGGGNLHGMRAWKSELDRARTLLPPCAPVRECVEWGPPDEWGGTVCLRMDVVRVANPPCKGPLNDDRGNPLIPAEGGSIDDNLADEFAEVRQAVDGLIGPIETFRQAAKRCFDDMTAAYDDVDLTQSGGVNPVRYGWLDSRGGHFAEVGVGPFKVAYLKKKTSGNTLKKATCIILRDFKDDTGANTWVSITRQDPSREIGFWRWNPSGGLMSKIGRASYSYNHVDVAN